MIRVLLVAPTPALRAGLRSLLAADPDIQVVAERGGWGGVANVEGAQAEADVVVTTSASLASAQFDGEWVAPDAPLLFLRDEPLPALLAARWSTVWGVLPLECTSGELTAAVRALAEGLVVGSRALLFSDHEASPERGPLTQRESEVLGWLARGLANKQIAVELGISEHTVKFHISSIYAKLNATNRTQAVREGLRNGWILL